MNKAFWFLLAVLAALASHIGYVLFVPSTQFHNEIAALTTGGKDAKWLIIDDRSKASLLPGFGGMGVAAICALDLRKDRYKLSLDVPNTYWSLAIYSETGKQFYALNDKQAGVETFEIEVARAKSLIEQLSGVGDVEEGADAILNAAWTVEIPDSRGFAVFWIPASSPLEKELLTERLQKARCELKGTT